MVLKHAKALYAQGLGTHWIKQNSKAPVVSGWAAGVREQWPQLERSYNPGYGLGIRLGLASKIGNAYLSCIDIDIRATDPVQQEKALRTAEMVLKQQLPLVHDAYKDGKLVVSHTGRGGGSRHIFFLVDNSLSSKKLSSAGTNTKVFSPSSKVTRIQKQDLSEDELDSGMRVKKLWEIDLMSTGRQVLIAPTVHPDTGRAYRFEGAGETSVPDFTKMPVFKASEVAPSLIDTKNAQQSVSLASGGTQVAGGALALKRKEFVVNDDIDLISVDLPQSTVEMLASGEGVTDRSAALMSVAMTMAKRGWSDDDMLSLLTDRNLYLGGVAYEHRRTDDRFEAARWVYDYTIVKAKHEVSAAKAFSFSPMLETRTGAEAENGVAGRTEVSLDDLEDFLGGGDFNGFGIPGSEELGGAQVLKGPSAGWETRLETNQDGLIKRTLYNAYLILTNTISVDFIRYDTFTGNIVFNHDVPWGSKKGEEIKDGDQVRCRYWLAETRSLDFPKHIIEDAFCMVYEKNKFSSLREYLLSVPEWDGVPRLDTWLRDYASAEAPEPYLSYVSRLWVSAMVVRGVEPGTKFDCVPILEGVQGAGKSMLGKALAGDKWFIDALPNLDSKDAMDMLRGVWLVELGELASLRRNQLESIKAFLAKSADKFRPAYGKHTITSDRHCIFYGTTNSASFLKDLTGNRRFWPILVGDKIDVQGVVAIREQLFAEALHSWMFDGTKLYLDNTTAVKQQKLLVTDKMIEDHASKVVERLRDFFYCAPQGWEALQTGRISTLWLIENPNSPIYGLANKNPHYAVTEVATALSALRFRKMHTNKGKRWVYCGPAQGEDGYLGMLKEEQTLDAEAIEETASQFENCMVEPRKIGETDSADGSDPFDLGI